MSTWRKEDETTWSRPMGSTEGFLKALHDLGVPFNLDHWSLTCSARLIPGAELNSSAFLSRMRSAWIALRYSHPGIATKSIDRRLIYEVPDARRLDDWLKLTFIVDETSGSIVDCIRDFQRIETSILTFVPRTNEVALHCPHTVTDGIGVMYLLDTLLKLLVDPKTENFSWGNELSRLWPHLEDAMGLPSSTEASESDQQLAQDYCDTWSLSMGSVGLESDGDAKTPPRGTAIAEHVFDALKSQKIFEACKKIGISVTSAVHSSVAAANRVMAHESRRDNPYASVFRFDPRRVMGGSFKDPKYAAVVYTSGWVGTVPANATWMENAKYYNSLYKKGYDPELLRIHNVYADKLANWVDGLSKAPPSDSTPSEIDISSIGLVEKLVKREYGEGSNRLELASVRINVHIITRQGILYVTTFRDRLNLSVCYNEAYHNERQMESFVGHVVKFLLENLDV